jgi:hypothetical protein
MGQSLFSLRNMNEQPYFKDYPTVLDEHTHGNHSQLNDTANEFNGDVFFVSDGQHNSTSIKRVDLATKMVLNEIIIDNTIHQAHYTAFGYCALGNSFGELTIHKLNNPDFKKSIQVHELPGREKTMNNQIVISKTPWNTIGLYLARNNNTIEVFVLDGEDVTSFEMITSGTSCVNHISLNADATLIAGNNSDGHTYLHRYDYTLKKYVQEKSFVGGSYGGSISVDSKYIACFSLSLNENLIIVYAVESSTVMYNKYVSYGYHLPKFSPSVPNLLMYANMNASQACGVLIEKNKCKTFNLPYVAPTDSFAYTYRATFSGDGRYYIIGSTFIVIFEMNEKYWIRKKHLGDKIFKVLNKSAFIDLVVVI